MEEEVKGDPLNLGGTGKAGFDKPNLVMMQVNRCALARSKEMTKGYTTYKFDKLGNAFPVIIPDSRKEFISSVTALRTMLAPEIEQDKDKEYEKKEEEILEQIQEHFDEHAFKPFKKIVTGKDKMGNEQTKLVVVEGKKYMPEPGSAVIVPDKYGVNLVREDGGWDAEAHAYIDACVGEYDEMLAELNKLIARFKYFKRAATIQ